MTFMRTTEIEELFFKMIICTVYCFLLNLPGQFYLIVVVFFTLAMFCEWFKHKFITRFHLEHEYYQFILKQFSDRIICIAICTQFV